ncbi:MAG: hypothetical protein WD425_21160 [Nitrospirales bacterium]
MPFEEVHVYSGHEYFCDELDSVSFAGMMESLKGKADEAKHESIESMANKKPESGKAIEAKDATKGEAGGMMDQLKQGAKEKTNETIDNMGKYYVEEVLLF